MTLASSRVRERLKTRPRLGEQVGQRLLQMVASRLMWRAAVTLLPALAMLLSCGSPPPRLEPGTPVVLIVVDTLRADRLGLYGYERATSPELEGWAKRGALFERAIATSPWTLPSVASALTGLYPLSHGAGTRRKKLPSGRSHTFFGLDAGVPTLTSVLAEHGYATGAFVTNTFLRPEFGLARDFDIYDHTRNSGLYERPADVMVDRSLEWVDAQGQRPFFLLLHLLDPHLPYDPPEPYRGRFTADYEGVLRVPYDQRQRRQIKKGRLQIDDGDRRFISATYDEQLAFVDAQVSRFLIGLEERELLSRSLVVFTSDHGEEFWDHGRFEHGHSFFQELLHIPMLVWGPEVLPGRRSEEVSLIDLLPTIFDALAIPTEDTVDGISLWPLLTQGRSLPDRPLLAHNNLFGSLRQMLIRWPHKLILRPESGATLLYDLELDPSEQVELSSQEGRLLQRLARELGQWRSKQVATSKEMDLSEEARQQLEALGYLN